MKTKEQDGNSIKVKKNVHSQVSINCICPNAHKKAKNIIFEITQRKSLHCYLKVRQKLKRKTRFCFCKQNLRTKVQNSIQEKMKLI